MKLPESLYFLRPGWWLVHVVAVGVVFAAGFITSHHLAGHDDHGGDAHGAHAGRHDHTSPEVLRPLMRGMLDDTVRLQGALAEGDLARAATHADAIATACGDGDEEEHAELPARLGPSFLELDRELHGGAGRFGGGAPGWPPRSGALTHPRVGLHL